jgi:hypothetical protein
MNTFEQQRGLFFFHSSFLPWLFQYLDDAAYSSRLSKEDDDKHEDYTLFFLTIPVVYSWSFYHLITSPYIYLLLSLAD